MTFKSQRKARRWIKLSKWEKNVGKTGEDTKKKETKGKNHEDMKAQCHIEPNSKQSLCMGRLGRIIIIAAQPVRLFNVFLQAKSDSEQKALGASFSRFTIFFWCGVQTQTDRNTQAERASD